MKIKKILQVLGFSFLLVFGGSMLFTSCIESPKDEIQKGDEDESSKDETQKGDEDESSKDETQDSNSDFGISFNMGAFTGLAIADGTATVSRSAARSAVSDGMLVKILEDGSIENFINVPENANLSSVSFITQSPAESSKEIYVVFNDRSWWYEDHWTTDEWGNTWVDSTTSHELGQLICVYENGSFCDILKSDDGTWRSLCNNSNQDSPIKFDHKGNMYYQVYESTGSNSTNMIYKFNPKTKEQTQLVAAVPNTTYEQFYVSKDGQWIIVKASIWNVNGSKSYLRAIPVFDTENPVNLWSDSNGNQWLQQWVYDENSRNIYFIFNQEFYKIPYKNGTYDLKNRVKIGGFENNDNVNDEDILTEVGGFWSDHLLDWKDGYYEYSLVGRSQYEYYDNELKQYKYFYFMNPDTMENDYKAVVDCYFYYLPEYLLAGREVWNEETGCWEYINYRDKYEIRFDIFENIEGFEKLSTETKDENGNSLADEELFKAVVEKDLLKLLYDALYLDRYNKQNQWNFYDYNFYADILFEKESGNKIDVELFSKEKTGFTRWDPWSINIFKEKYVGSYHTWKSEFINEETGTVDSEKVMAKFAEWCAEESIEFSLECFKDDETYADLYTDLKNEEAIKFLDTKEKTELLHNAINSSGNGVDFLAKTCFIPGTDTPAWGNNTDNSDSNDSTYIDWWSLEHLVSSNNALYAIDRNNGKIVQLVNSDGEAVCEYVDMTYDPESKISGATVLDNTFYFECAVLDSTGWDLGCQFVSRFNPDSLTLEDMFESIPNNKTYQLVSYTVGGGNLYCCLARGTLIKNVKVDLDTKDWEELNSGTKLSQIIIVK